MRIVYIIESLAFKGGTERMLTAKANYLADHYGYDISIITCVQQNSSSNTFPLSSKVKQINISIPYYFQYKYKYPKRIWVKIKMYRRLQRTITNTIREINPDIIIGVCHYKANIVSSIKCKAMIIIECHEIRSFTLSGVHQHRSFFSKLYMHYYRNLYFRTIEKKADAIVTLTEGDKLLWKKAKRVEVIPNFSTIAVNQLSDCEAKRVIAVGRLEKEKGFERLLEAWKPIVHKHPDWKLDIFGEGTLREKLESYIQENGLSNVMIHQRTTDISSEYQHSSICVMTSFCEGFALVLLEALKHGVPCVAFDCPYGPRNIIKDNNCGFLVEDGNIELLTDKICTLIEDSKLRSRFSEAAINQAKGFNEDVIMEMWNSLFKTLIQQKRK